MRTACRSAAGVRILFGIIALGCGADGSDASSPAAALPLRDPAAIRAKVSACTGQPVDAAFTFFWPRHLGGVSEDDSVQACVAAAGDCSEVLACAGYAGAGCTSTQRCDGNVMKSCRRFGKYGITAERHLDCADDRSGNSICSVDVDPKNSLDGSVASCHGPNCTETRCDADVWVTCVAGHERRYDCGIEGKRCIETNGQTACGFPEACAEDHCSNDLLVRCSDGHVALRESCSRLIPGSTCTGEGPSAWCHAPVAGAGCAGVTDDSSWCEGELGVFCMAGVRVEADCGALPNGTCRLLRASSPSVATCTADTPFDPGN
jgi:hypothetical protein